MSDGESYSGWAIVELMGHRRLAGKVSQVEQYGSAMLRLDVPGPLEEEWSTQFYSGAAIYCITPTNEEIVRGLALRIQPEPVSRWELPAPERPTHEAVQRQHIRRVEDEGYEDDDFALGEDDED
jgi:hypothetical protein